GHQAGMRVDHAGGCIETGLRNAPHSNFSAVSGYVLHQPVNGIVRIGALIGVARTVLHRLVWPDDRVVSFAHETAADILVDEDELRSKRASELRIVVLAGPSF